MNWKRKASLLYVAAALAAGFAVAQLIDTPPSAAHFLPKGALVYAETPDLKQLLTWWRDSEFRKNWQASTSEQAYETSRLYLKLDDRLADLGKDSYSFDLERLIEVAGKRSAVALYDIGELKAVAISEIPFAEASATDLWSARSHFKTKKNGAQNYYVEPKEGKLLFAYVKPYLVVASDETLFLQTLNGIGDANAPDRLDADSKWIACRSFKPGGGMFSLYLDQERLNGNEYFEDYWIQHNVEDLKNIQAAWIDFTLQLNALTEHRYFVLAGGGVPGGAPENLEQYLKPFENVRSEVLQVDLSPAPKNVTNSVTEMLNHFPESRWQTSYPPAYSAAAERASQAEAKSVYSQQIDEPLLQPAAETMLRADEPEKLVAVFEKAKVQAETRFRYPLWDDKALFVQFPCSVLLQMEHPEAVDQAAFLNLMKEYFLVLHSTQDQGAAWVPSEKGGFKLESLNPVFVKLQGPWLLISNREEEFKQIAALLPASAALPHNSYALVNVQNARWKYSRLMQRLETGETDKPLFFSENLASLIDSLGPIHRVSMERTPSEEIIHYEYQ